MSRNVTEYVEHAVRRWPTKTAFVDGRRSITFAGIHEEALTLATALLPFSGKPIAVLLERSIDCVSSFLGSLYSGNFYVFIDPDMPESRINKILHTIAPAAIITDGDGKTKVAMDACCLRFDEICNESADKPAICARLKHISDADPACLLFTSGSTGEPKGVVISHRSIIGNVETFSQRFGIDDTFVIGNQSTFSHALPIRDIYDTFRNGTTTCIIPKSDLAFPADLMRYLKQHSVSGITFVPTLMTIIAAHGLLDDPATLPPLRLINFGGEPMQATTFNAWRSAYPDAIFINDYGMTELGGYCILSHMTQHYPEGTLLPVGTVANLCDVLLLNSALQKAQSGEEAEVYVRGSRLSAGYFRNQKKTAEVFIQNPLHDDYPDIVYRTGDIVRLDDAGRIFYLGRKDTRIKHFGYRIELGEIEAATSALTGVDVNCCLYNAEKQQLVLFYTGSAEEKLLRSHLSALLPKYMLPKKYVRLEDMPLTPSGKIHRVALAARLEQL